MDRIYEKKYTKDIFLRMKITMVCTVSSCYIFYIHLSPKVPIMCVMCFTIGCNDEPKSHPLLEPGSIE